ncbi:MAG: hypothetical protein HRT87_05085 [Legionellales bacterium]|nr:hypothetical protein [Legionellales bacterium]
MQILDLSQIKKRINLNKIITMQEEGFKLYSLRKVDTPPVGYIEQKKPPGSYHIKYGLIENDTIWVTKIAGGLDSLPLNGIIIVISTITGAPIGILEDQGYLTQLRTATAGLISAKYLAPKNIKSIGIIGNGQQAEMQLDILKNITDCRIVFVWGRSEQKNFQYKRKMEKRGFKVRIAQSGSEIVRNCNLIITTTSAKEPVLTDTYLLPGTHITAIGADSPGKIELNPEILKKADIICLDSKEQCIDHGEISYAFHKKIISKDKLVELGQVIANNSLGRTNEEQITITDLTGIAVQDIQIAKSVLDI